MEHGNVEVQDKAPQWSEKLPDSRPSPLSYKIISTSAERRRWLLDASPSPSNKFELWSQMQLPTKKPFSGGLPAALHILNIILSVKFSFGWINLTQKSQATF